jgi:predicted CoA-binding protein
MNQTELPAHVTAFLKNKSPETRIAVVGASNSPEKYGNIIVRQLAGQGYAVLPVNPKEATIGDLTAYPNINVVPEPVDIVDFVTPPAATLKILEGMRPAVFKVIWFQDGSWDDACVTYAQSRFDTVVYHACIMVASRTVRA